MPHLTWASKTTPTPVPGFLEVDSLVYPQGAGYPEAVPQDRLILGDNLAVMSTLLPAYEGRIQLIYADPPFFTNRHYPARVGRGEDSRQPQGWQLAEGYPDAWPDLDTYLDMLYPRLALMHRLLAPEGTLYLHLDWHANAYARLLLDEIFGPERLLNEVVWVYHGPSPIRSAFNRKHDTLLVYTKGSRHQFHADAVRQPYDPTTIKTFASSRRAGFGKVPNLARGKVPEDWWYFPVVARLHTERTGYPTQKPAALLERILLASSSRGDLVADFFSGSGTLAEVAARLGRRYIASDVSFRAVHTARVRLSAAGASPFTFESEARSQFPPALPAGWTAELTPTSITLPEDALVGLDYWECDPAWEGSLFHSAAQASRPTRSGTISASLTLPPAQSGQKGLLRLVNIHGIVSQLPFQHL